MEERVTKKSKIRSKRGSLVDEKLSRIAQRRSQDQPRKDGKFGAKNSNKETAEVQHSSSRVLVPRLQPTQIEKYQKPSEPAAESEKASAKESRAAATQTAEESNNGLGQTQAELIVEKEPSEPKQDEQNAQGDKDNGVKDTSGTSSEILQANDIGLIQKECADTMDIEKMMEAIGTSTATTEETTKDDNHNELTMTEADNVDKAEDNLEEKLKDC